MSEVQAEFNERFLAAIAKRNEAQEALSAATSAIPRLKATIAQVRADVATIRADARAAGVKLPKVAAANDDDNQAA